MNQYDIIIGAGHFDLTLPFGYSSPKEDGYVPRKIKPSLFTRA